MNSNTFSQHKTSRVLLFTYFVLAFVLIVGFFNHRLSTIQFIAGCVLFTTEIVLHSGWGRQFVTRYPLVKMMPRINAIFLCIYPFFPQQSSISLGVILEISGYLLLFILIMPVKEWARSYFTLMTVSVISVTLLFLLFFCTQEKIVIDNPIQILALCLPPILCLSLFFSIPWVFKILLHMKQEKDGLSLNIGSKNIRNIFFDSKDIVRKFQFFHLSILVYRKERRWRIDITN